MALFGAPDEVARSLAPKSTTAPVALGLSKELGGIPPLTAALTILTGIVGAILGQAVARLVRVRRRARARARPGRCLARDRHGTSAADLRPRAGAFAGIGFALNATFTAVVLPLLLVEGLGVL